MNCPNCGSEKVPQTHTIAVYACGFRRPSDVGRSKECYEREIQNLKADLTEALETGHWVGQGEAHEKIEQLAAERDGLKAQLAEANAALDEEAVPKYCCSRCGSLGPFIGITYPATPNGPEEYDMKCEYCGSLEIAESPEGAVLELAQKLDTAEKQLAEAREKHKAEPEVASLSAELADVRLKLSAAELELTAQQAVRDKLSADLSEVKKRAGELVQTIERLTGYPTAEARMDYTEAFKALKAVI
jgi:chromosome segregation ATPase